MVVLGGGAVSDERGTPGRCARFWLIWVSFLCLELLFLELCAMRSCWSIPRTRRWTRVNLPNNATVDSSALWGYDQMCKVTPVMCKVTPVILHGFVSPKATCDTTL
ncbi:hypothetical protein T484DRAFT_2159051 [Baffinella frigidus]|nr:hypothetical protein T484DRAFT_2159051 [Cryptophyta sp. CCMP2293]